MSAPNSSYDPVAVTPLSAEAVQAMRDEALAAVAAAGDLEALKTVRLAHAGDRSPLALANREIGAPLLRPRPRPASGWARPVAR
jgi:phenylalanyl-tRNA synthetase alpha chain